MRWTEHGPALARRITGLGTGDLREVVMGAQDNLTNVLAVVLGVTIGSGRSETVALAGLAAGVAEAVSMGGVLYTATRTEERLRNEELNPVRAAVVCAMAAFVAALIPLTPFLALPIQAAVLVSLGLSIVAIFALGSWAGWLTRRTPWQEGLRLLAVTGAAAGAAALVGVLLGQRP